MNNIETIMVEKTRKVVNKVIQKELGWPPPGCFGLFNQPVRPKIEIEAETEAEEVE